MFDVGDLPVLTFDKGRVIKWPMKLYVGLRFLRLLRFFFKIHKT